MQAGKFVPAQREPEIDNPNSAWECSSVQAAFPSLVVRSNRSSCLGVLSLLISLERGKSRPGVVEQLASVARRAMPAVVGSVSRVGARKLQ